MDPREFLSLGTAHPIDPQAQAKRWRRRNGVANPVADFFCERPPYVYFMRCGNGMVKIGRTADLKRRLSAIRCCNPFSVTLEAYVSAPPEFERLLHQLFEVYCDLGEWFRPSKNLDKLIAAIKDKNEEKIKIAILVAAKESMPASVTVKSI